MILPAISQATVPLPQRTAVRIGLFRLLLACVMVLFGSVSVVPALAADSVANNVVARINDSSISRDDLNRRLAAAGIDPTSVSPHQRLRMTRLMAAEFVAEQRLDQHGTLPATLARTLAETRRQVMLDYYVRDRLDNYRPTDAEIQRFATQNPQMFSGRETFRYQQLRMRWDDAAQKRAAIGLVRSFAGRASVTPESVNELKLGLTRAGVQLQAASLVRSTEQLDSKLGTRFDQMRDRRTPVSMINQKDTLDVLILQQRVADPVDANLMKNQIAAALVRQHVERQRTQIIARLTASAQLTDPPGGNDASSHAADNTELADGGRSRWAIIAQSLMPDWLMRSGDRLAIVLILVLALAPIPTMVGMLRARPCALKRAVWPVITCVAITFGLVALVSAARALDPKIFVGLSIAGMLIGGLAAWIWHRLDASVGPRIRAALVLLCGVAQLALGLIVLPR